MDIVIVESPAKAKTINKYLGRDYEVIASFGHVRDLPAKDGSVDPEHDFHMIWEVDAKASKRLGEIAKAVKAADRVILATDPDREGEAISWHVLEVLKDKKVLKGKKIQRVVFNAITKAAISEALRHPREIDQALVEAYLARRALDYLVGFTLSPVLWRKLPGARSAGRVQSVTLRLICDREVEIEKFIPREYWSVVAHLQTEDHKPFLARLVGADDKKINRLDISNAEEAETFKKALETAHFRVFSIESKPVKRHPSPPFTTSTLQQEASRKFGFSPARTMQIAQRLYEGVDVEGETLGLITYMRTDGVDMAPEAIEAARRVISKNYSARHLPERPRHYTAKAKNAQEAHEAIRPTDITRRPQDLRSALEPDQARLYDLIWTRTLASQMESAELERTVIEIQTEGPLGTESFSTLHLRATGQVVRFEGFLALYQEGKDDEEEEDAHRLPAMALGDSPTRDHIAIQQHFTEPPPRYTEATLIKKMEELGIGRPSTYASTLGVLKDRGYVLLDKKRLRPEDKGRLVTAFLESFFNDYIQYDFTADLEAKLDQVSNNEMNWMSLLRQFWENFIKAVDATKDLRTTQVLDALNDLLGPHIFPKRLDGSDPRSCPQCGEGRLSLKIGKFGAFIGCSNYPDCRYTGTLTESVKGEGQAAGQEKPGIQVLGLDPETEEEISLREGRFGPYIQRGDGNKPKRASLPKSLAPADVTLEKALILLSLPRQVALHPETGKPIYVGLGRFGSYVHHEKTYATLNSDDDLFEIGANRAIDLILTKEQNPGSSRSQQSSGRILGTHPEGQNVVVKSGRFGAYVNWKKVNATIPSDKDPERLTLDEALELLKLKQSGSPREGERLLGTSPAGDPVLIKKGRYGPYINCQKINIPLPASLSSEEITLEEALDLLATRTQTSSSSSFTKSSRSSSKTRASQKGKKKEIRSKSASSPRASIKKPASSKAKKAAQKGTKKKIIDT